MTDVVTSDLALAWKIKRERRVGSVRTYLEVQPPLYIMKNERRVGC